MRFPLTLGARGSCTIGGLTSTNAGGTQVLKFGTMRALVAGVEAVLPDGSIHYGLSGLKKDNRGYSLDQLLIGAEGTLGVVTAAALRLVPAVAARAVAWAGVDSPAARSTCCASWKRAPTASKASSSCRRIRCSSCSSISPARARRLQASHRWHVLIEATTAGRGDDIAGDLERFLGDAFEQGIIGDATIAASEAQAEAFWKIRDSISEAERAEGQTLAHDISVAVADMPGFIVEASAEVERAFPGVVASGFGHLGDGNIHFHVRAGQPCGAGLVRRRGRRDYALRRRSGHRRWRLDLRRARHRPIEARRVRPPRPPGADPRSARDQAGA